MRLNGFAHVGNRSLGRDTQHLRKSKRADCLNESCAARGQRQRQQQLAATLHDDAIDQELETPWQDQTHQPINDHQQTAQRQTVAVGPN